MGGFRSKSFNVQGIQIGWRFALILAVFLLIDPDSVVFVFVGGYAVGFLDGRFGSDLLFCFRNLELSRYWTGPVSKESRT